MPGYANVQELGRGGNGRVVIALHTATARHVAIKYLNEELGTSTAFRTAFQTEAKLLSSLNSPHVTQLYEYVEAQQGAAIVMELIAGAALRALLRQEGPTGPEAALVVLKGSLLGLAAAHSVDVVHRDYKPENVLVSMDGQSKLADFGIAARTGDHCKYGTPAYMAPEQWRQESATAATDVYAATVTFYECLTGVRPFNGTTWELLAQHVNAPVPLDDVPEAVRSLVLHGMAKDPAQRPENALAFLQELERVAASAYGPDWEERGQSRLAALAALLPLVFSHLKTTPVGAAADLALTVLPGGRRTQLLKRDALIAGAAALGVAAIMSLMPGGWAGQEAAHAEQTGAHAQAVTTLKPGDDDSSSPSGRTDTDSREDTSTDDGGRDTGTPRPSPSVGATAPEGPSRAGSDTGDGNSETPTPGPTTPGPGDDGDPSETPTPGPTTPDPGHHDDPSGTPTPGPTTPDTGHHDDPSGTPTPGPTTPDPSHSGVEGEPG
ncbi:serine/threonine-protein kinase [Streptomyces sp. NA02950]|uniref:serine/threonine-protein kinase n=1 Tax=Streptomyces sp. NA02950 TaxID=2742137 RepID=UPI0026DFAD25|nr:serine/threonine-protein kinase [Streptomyces sp. NA02950]